jgi:hypothetical protein
LTHARVNRVTGGNDGLRHGRLSDSRPGLLDLRCVTAQSGLHAPAVRRRGTPKFGFPIES